MRLRKPCQHGRYDTHYVARADFADRFCPGGEFLADDPLIIEKVDGEWPDWAFRAISGIRPTSTLTVERTLDVLTVRKGAE